MPREMSEDRIHLDPVGGPEIKTHTVYARQNVTLGRSTECDVCLPESSISRQHASLSCHEGNWILTDLHSRHGTFLNGCELTPGQPSVIGFGDLLRIGSFTFRFSSNASAVGAMATTNEAVPQGTIVQRVPDRELDSLAHQRLALLIDGAAAIHQAEDETDLARAMVDLVIAGTGYQRAAVLRFAGATDQVNVVASHDIADDQSSEFTFSRSLLHATMQGDVASLTRTDMHDFGQSIERLGITTAICAPIIVDATVIGAVYLDSRDPMHVGHPDAAGFCHAISRFGSLALSSIKRADLEQRQQRLEADLKAAQLAQVLLCPKEEGAVAPLHFALKTEPGRVVAGDLFDIFPLSDQKIGICCGDVTGQGMGAAVVMATVLSHLRSSLAQHGEPVAAITDVNAYISQHSPDNVFVTLWVGVLDEKRTLTYVDAGHGYWMVRKAGQVPLRATKPGNLVVGIDATYDFSAQSLELAPGDRIHLFSDGMIEHTNPVGEEFGWDRFIRSVTNAATPTEEVAAAMSALEHHVGSPDLPDDRTIASIELVD